MFKKNVSRKMEYQKQKIELFKKLVSDIDISRYNQKEFIKIVNLIYQDIFRIE